MTVSNTTSVVQYNGNGVTVAWPTGYRFFKNTDLVVTKRSVSGTTTLLTLNTDYSVSGANSVTGGTVTTTNPLLGGATPELLTIARVLTVQQLTDLRNQGDYFAEIHEDVFDYLTMLIQQTGESDSRALRHPRDSEHYQAEGRRIVDLESPVDPQDAATRASVEAYVASVLATGQGPINNAANVAYVYPNAAVRNVQSLSNYTDPLLGSQGIGHYNSSGTLQTAGDVLNRAVETVDSVYALLSAPKKQNCGIYVPSYHTGWAATTNGAIGGGMFIWAATKLKSAHNGGTVISPTVPWDGTQGGLSAFLSGTGETAPAGQGCWVRVNSRPDVLMFGARADNTSNDLAAFQKAADSVKTPFIPNGTYTLIGTLLFNSDGTTFAGESMSGTVLNFQGAGVAFKNPAATTTTRLFCGINNLRINALAAGANNIVDWKSMQFGRISKVWILGQSTVGCVAINLAATWVVTECTYNVIEDCYFGLFATGISISDGANNNNIARNRFQPSFASGIGILLAATSTGRVSVINIIGNGFEFPGNISTGINVLQNCDFVNIQGNRFEQLLSGIVVGAVGNKHITGTSRGENYFESCTNSINLSGGANSARPGLIASGAYASGVALGSPFGLGPISNPSLGVYTFTYLDTTYPDSGQVIEVTASTPIAAVSQTATGFTVTCQNLAGASAAAALIGVNVLYNK
ncbi:phage tail fiber domain-containing protein [Pseudomonas sp. GB2N2]